MCERIGDCLLYHGDCFDVLAELPPDSVDLVLADPPYGITQCKWDSVLNLDRLWPELWRVTKPRAAVVMTAAQPFSSTLVQSNISGFKYEWVWIKNRGANFGSLKYQPMREHESVLVFSVGGGGTCYHPIKIERLDRTCRGDRGVIVQHTRGAPAIGGPILEKFRKPETRLRYPRSVLSFNVVHGKERQHPTQKPVALMEYMIKTYTNAQQAVVLDFCMGSGTTGIACINTERVFIGVELDPEHYATAHRRLTEHLAKPLSARIKPPPKRRRRRKGPPRDQMVLFSSG